MYLYIIVLPGESTVLADNIRSGIPDHYELVPDRTWIAGSHLETCADIMEQIKAGKSHGQMATALVSKVDRADTNGWAAITIWEKLNAWTRKQ